MVTVSISISRSVSLWPALLSDTLLSDDGEDDARDSTEKVRRDNPRGASDSVTMAMAGAS